MEVHHPHHPTHKKKWSEYIIEFVMLFTAVALGFFSENIREEIAEKHKKQELLKAVVYDFKTDHVEIQRHRLMIKRRLKNCDEFVKLLEMDYKKVNKINFYRIAMWHAENKDLILNINARTDAEAKGYFTKEGISELSGILNKFNYYYNDYKVANLAIMESCKRYYSNIIPEILDPKLVLKSDFVWLENSTTTDKDFQGTLIKPIDKSIKDQILFDIWTRKTLLILELNNFDALDTYSNKAIIKLSSEIK